MHHLEIISDTDSEIDDPTYIPSEEEHSSSDECCDFCYYCETDLEVEENEFYDSEADRFYCRRCWNDIHEH
jgi:hypothetical protein